MYDLIYFYKPDAVNVEIIFLGFDEKGKAGDVNVCKKIARRNTH